ncbi:MAG: hypothetical protein K8S20_13145 [Chloroflexi bacterium]|nr:hypothetical protein [Chloroflexota bacterium]
MKKSGFFLHLTIAAIILITTVSSCKFPPGPTQYTEFYVSVKGSDSTGKGTKSNPWRHIQYAIDHASAQGGTTLRINLMKGIYQENLVIHKPMVILGVGTGKATTYPDDVNYPVEEVSIISRKDTSKPSILIENATSVNLQTLVVFGGGVRAVNTRFIMYNVEVTYSLGLYAVQLENVSMFYIEKSQIKTAINTRSDYGLDIMASSGDVINTYLGDLFDHTINVNSTVLGSKAPNPNSPLTIQSINIRDSSIAGSNIYYADGIRIQGPNNVKIINTKITRTHANNAAANSGTIYNPPYAGISAGGWLTEAQGHALVEIDGVTIGGFNVGIGLNPEGYNVKVQNSAISGIKYDVETKYNGYSGVSEPIIDFGGGPLGSAGKNDFAAGNPYAFYNDVPYQVDACFNQWNVAINQVDDLRIYDKLDVGTKGRVRWNCSADLILITPPTRSDLPTRNTPTPFSFKRSVRVTRDALCFVGPGESYGVISAINADLQLELLGVGAGGDYYVVTNPLYLVPCWVQTSSVEFDGNPGELSIIPIPTLTPIPAQPQNPDEQPITETPGPSRTRP